MDGPWLEEYRALGFKAKAGGTAKKEEEEKGGGEARPLQRKEMWKTMGAVDKDRGPIMAQATAGAITGEGDCENLSLQPGGSPMMAAVFLQDADNKNVELRTRDKHKTKIELNIWTSCATKNKNI